MITHEQATNLMRRLKYCTRDVYSIETYTSHWDVYFFGPHDSAQMPQVGIDRRENPILAKMIRDEILKLGYMVEVDYNQDGKNLVQVNVGHANQCWEFCSDWDLDTTDDLWAYIDVFCEMMVKARFERMKPHLVRYFAKYAEGESEATHGDQLKNWYFTFSDDVVKVFGTQKGTWNYMLMFEGGWDNQIAEEHWTPELANQYDVHGTVNKGE
jgi:hypothetical protein